MMIRSPNNKNEHGSNRDCYILDSRSVTPAHKFMFKYLGGFLAYAFLSKSPLPINLAPWVWKQLLKEEVTMADLEGIDTYSSQVLRDLKNYARYLSDEYFEAGVDQYFTTVLSTGEEVPLCPEGDSKKVTKENVQEFCDLVLDVRRHEADQQVEAIREGFLQVIQNKQDILDFCDWETLESRCLRSLDSRSRRPCPRRRYRTARYAEHRHRGRNGHGHRRCRPCRRSARHDRLLGPGRRRRQASSPLLGGLRRATGWPGADR